MEGKGREGKVREGKGYHPSRMKMLVTAVYDDMMMIMHITISIV